MKKAAVLLTVSVLLASASTTFATNYADINNNVNVETNGSDTNSSVSISNNVNTNSNTESSSKTNTSVSIHQVGEGTSEVTINGKTYKQDGPGDININENSELEDDKQSATPEASPTQHEKDVETEAIKSSVLENIREELKSIQESIKQFFVNLSHLLGRKDS